MIFPPPIVDLVLSYCYPTKFKRLISGTEQFLIAPDKFILRKSKKPGGRGTIKFWENEISDTFHACEGDVDEVSHSMLGLIDNKLYVLATHTECIENEATEEYQSIKVYDKHRRIAQHDIESFPGISVDQIVMGGGYLFLLVKSTLVYARLPSPVLASNMYIEYQTLMYSRGTITRASALYYLDNYLHVLSHRSNGKNKIRVIIRVLRVDDAGFSLHSTVRFTIKASGPGSCFAYRDGIYYLNDGKRIVLRNNDGRVIHSLNTAEKIRQITVTEDALFVLMGNELLRSV